MYASKAIETFHGLHKCCIIGGKDNKFPWCAYYNKIKCRTKFPGKDISIVIKEFWVQMRLSCMDRWQQDCFYDSHKHKGEIDNNVAKIFI